MARHSLQEMELPMRVALPVAVGVLVVTTMSVAARGEGSALFGSVNNQPASQVPSSLGLVVGLFSNLPSAGSSAGANSPTTYYYYPSNPTIGPTALTPSTTSYVAPNALSTVYSPLASAAITPATTADAFLNLGSGPYAEASSLTSGGALPWYDSPSATKAFGHMPNAQDIQNFSSAVLSRVQSTFAQSGIPVTLTTDPNANAAHTLSLVSNTSYAANPNAIGITDIGHNGFSFLDKISYATNPNDLEWAVAHNIAHELMHAFGGGHHDTTGQYLDAASVNWNTLINPSLTFSSASVAEQIQDLKTGGSSLTGGAGLEILQQYSGTFSPDDTTLGSPVPEPTTVALWGAASLGMMVIGKRKSGRCKAA